jgi:hypothetical protein
MIKSSNFMSTPNRTLAGKRWSAEEDKNLLERVQRHEDWIDISKALNRTFVGVQNRFRFLRNTNAHASTIVAKISTRAQNPDTAPDLTCGALGKAGRRVLEAVKNDISQFYGRPQETPAPLDETDLMMGALIRELLLQRYSHVTGWLRITVSRINASEHGIGKMGFSRILDDLEKCAFLERTVGYPGALTLPNMAARQGRFVLIRASARLVKLCRQRRITASNLFTQFPSLRG